MNCIYNISNGVPALKSLHNAGKVLYFTITRYYNGGNTSCSQAACKNHWQPFIAVIKIRHTLCLTFLQYLKMLIQVRQRSFGKTSLKYLIRKINKINAFF